ncbi:nitrate/nitrite two-component system sensor histidine kinase [Pseudoalteromonas rubra]|uniref:Sensor protein n=1 Tax=Pseudoalteromonas rubra TaxID=43658 RepID=A0A5S3WM58_9GAMM|nr:histidine kinase [Pseudoalteromonas rubra]TMP29070.1 nitrate/nitrite two-component system sensor histidine kinase [Pseudoalteromonas rubra]TMP33565.1 nitrate/nitrite two-component system sensor histidine kinase [Pseudoalteromonas rubra]
MLITFKRYRLLVENKWVIIVGMRFNELKSRFKGSVMVYIKGSIIGVISLAICTLFASYWIAELADLDARAINLSGSLRMDAYQLGMFGLEGRSEQVGERIALLEEKLRNPIFQKLQSDAEINQLWSALVEHWHSALKPELMNLPIENHSQFNELVAMHATYADNFVLAVQMHAESKIRLLRTIQVAALFITLLFGAFILHLISLRVEKPLIELTHAAYAIGKGNFTHQMNLKGDDELALLAATFNHTSSAIASMYGQLESRVKEQTQELEVNNQALTFLFKTARLLLESQENKIDLQHVLDDLAQLIEVDDIELCLMTASGDIPYAQLKPHTDSNALCGAKNCDNCDGSGAFIALAQPTVMKFPLVYGSNNYGVIVVRGQKRFESDSWQMQLVQSVADQVALSLNLEVQHDQERRIALLNERTVIARELHDSLAQALSYLKIQVTRLSKTQEKQKFDLQPPIIDELKMGLDSAYRQLRELLTTFRLKMVSEGLEAALEKTIEQLSEQSKMQFHLNFAIQQIPLSPMEEIHLLQITREACQNTVHHSKGNNVWVDLRVTEDKRLQLVVADDGVGIASGSEKLNHYGMAIMQERAKHLHGELFIVPRAEKGTEVKLLFQPAGGSQNYH